MAARVEQSNGNGCNSSSNDDDGSGSVGSRASSFSDAHVDPEVVDGQLRRYLEERGLLEENGSSCWRIELSKLSGRGVMASRDIKRGELVYGDAALVLGPRCYNKYLPMCAGCHKRGCALFPCERGCGLPVCSDACQEGESHFGSGECDYLSSLQPDCGSQGWSLDVLRALVPVRALLLPSRLREICYALQCNRSAQEAREVDGLKKIIRGTIEAADEEFMRRVCNVMDTNAFESATLMGSEPTSLRALFPLGALTNHQCAPNTRHLVDEQGRLFVYAAIDIPRGEEITMAYTELLWDTTMRRQFLLATKQFSCRCPRCADPTEFNSLLGALSCAKIDCSGILLPIDPLTFNSNWICNECGLVIKNKQIASIRAGILAATEEVIYDNPRKILQFIRRELSVLVPKTNHFMLDMIFRIISLFGRVDGYTWKDLTDDELNVKAEYCRYLVDVLDQLNCGDCMKKGLILYELYCTNAEKLERSSFAGEKDSLLSAHENEKILIETMDILKNDVAAPNDYRYTYATRSVSTTGD